MLDDKADSKNLPISSTVLDNGFSIDPGFEGKYEVTYPKEIFDSLDKDGKESLAQNFTYTRTRPLALLFDRLDYQFSKPICQDLVDYGVEKDLPRVSDFIKQETKHIRDRVCDPEKIRFADGQSSKLISQDQTTEKAIMALSFGKDSLLSYALLKEIGMDLQVVFGVEMESQNSGEYSFKNRIMESFSKEQGEKIMFFEDTADDMYYAPTTEGLGEFENTNGMLAFALELIPFSFHSRAKYIVFGNEKNMDDTYINPYGEEAYPSFDQSSTYTAKTNYMLRTLTKESVGVMSVVEPIYNLAEMRILYHRYPHLLQYVMSCSPPEGSRSRWCYSCPMCAKSFLYSLAVGGNPKDIAFDEDLFQATYAELYPLFTKNIKRPYEKPPAVKEEQLLAFLLAYRLGAKGDLMTIFEQNYLQEALLKEKQLRERFFGIHDGPSIPAHLKPQLIAIYQSELAPMLS